MTDSGNLSASLTIKVTVTQDGKLIVNPSDPTKPSITKTPVEPTKIEKDPENRATSVLKASKIPKTGDSSMIWLVFVGLGLTAIGISSYQKSK